MHLDMQKSMWTCQRMKGIKEVSNRASKCLNPCGRVDHAVW